MVIMDVIQMKKQDKIFLIIHLLNTQKIVKETGGHTKKWRIKNGYGLTGINDDNERRRLQLVNGNIDIPVIIHILYNSQSNNVNSYMRYINRLMINMNEGFNMLNNDVSTNWGNIPG
eukprot:304546_1